MWTYILPGGVGGLNSRFDVGEVFDEEFGALGVDLHCFVVLFWHRGVYLMTALSVRAVSTYLTWIRLYGEMTQQGARLGAEAPQTDGFASMGMILMACICFATALPTYLLPFS